VLIIVAAAAGVGCSTESARYHDQPLVAKVASGMTQEQVLQVGGKPLAASDRTVVPGTCFDYLLTQAGQSQVYSVSFDATQKVDGTHFMTCAQWSQAQQKAREPAPNMGGVGGSGY
jgi:osmotically inducible lipoprotein OsmE